MPNLGPSGESICEGVGPVTVTGWPWGPHTSHIPVSVLSPGRAPLPRHPFLSSPSPLDPPRPGTCPDRGLVLSRGVSLPKGQYSAILATTTHHHVTILLEHAGHPHTSPGKGRPHSPGVPAAFGLMQVQGTGELLSPRHSLPRDTSEGIQHHEWPLAHLVNEGMSAPAPCHTGDGVRTPSSLLPARASP